MAEISPDFPEVLLYAVPFFVSTVALEWWLVHRKSISGRYDIKDAFSSMTMGLGNLIAGLLLGIIGLTLMMFVWQFRLFDWGYSVPAIICALIAQDFFYYWKHRFSHTIRWFWSAHVVHHSSEHYNLTTALRQPWNSDLTLEILFYIPLVLLGVHPLLLLFVGSINLLYQYWIHTEAIRKLPKWFEAVLNTPSHHRVHHATNPRYLDSNFAGILIIWDRLFGTFVPEMDEVEDIKYGIIKPVGTFNPVKIAFVEMLNVFKDALKPSLKFSERLGYIFAPPGYSHDGSRKGSADLKRDYVTANPDQAGTPGLPDSGI